MPMNQTPEWHIGQLEAKRVELSPIRERYNELEAAINRLPNRTDFQRITDQLTNLYNSNQSHLRSLTEHNSQQSLHSEKLFSFDQNVNNYQTDDRTITEDNPTFDFINRYRALTKTGINQNYSLNGTDILVTNPETAEEAINSIMNQYDIFRRAIDEFTSKPNCSSDGFNLYQHYKGGGTLNLAGSSIWELETVTDITVELIMHGGELKSIPTNVQTYMNLYNSAQNLNNQLRTANRNDEAALRAQQDNLANLNAAIENLRPIEAYNHGISLITEGNYEAAIECFNNAITLLEGSAQNIYFIHTAKGIAYLKNDNLDAAIDSFQEAIHLNADSAAAHFQLASALYQQDNIGNTEQSLNEFNRAQELDENFTAEASFYNGLIALNNNDVDQALANFEEAITANNNYLDAHYQKALILIDREQFDEALTELDFIIDNNGNYLDAHYQKSLIYYTQNNYEAAIEAANNCLAIEANNIKALTIKAKSIFATNENLEQVRAICDQIINLDNHNIDAYEFKAKVFNADGDIVRALETIREGLAHNEDNIRLTELVAYFEQVRQENIEREMADAATNLTSHLGSIHPDDEAEQARAQAHLNPSISSDEDVASNLSGEAAI